MRMSLAFASWRVDDRPRVEARDVDMLDGGGQELSLALRVDAGVFGHWERSSYVVIPAKAGTQSHADDRWWLWILTFVRMTVIIAVGCYSVTTLDARSWYRSSYSETIGSSVTITVSSDPNPLNAVRIAEP